MSFTVKKSFVCVDDFFIRFWSGYLRARVLRGVFLRVPGAVVGTAVMLCSGVRVRGFRVFYVPLPVGVGTCSHFTDEELVKEKVSELPGSSVP